MNKKLERILKENQEFEKKTPYNFCDRWCERCPDEKQLRCKLYLDEFEQKITCIAHSRDEDDLEITETVMRAQHEQIEEKLNEKIEEFGLGLDYSDISEDELEQEDIIDFNDLPPEIQKHIRFVENNPLKTVVKNYSDKARIFLKETFYKKTPDDAQLSYDFQTVSWYHTLLPAKLSRALAGFHEPTSEGEFALYDAVAQFQVCQKSVKESIKALRNIKQHFPEHHKQIRILIVLLGNIQSRIKSLLENI